jgi:magnesium chelatase subunit D
MKQVQQPGSRARSLTCLTRLRALAAEPPSRLTAWSQPALIAALLALDGANLGGAVLRGPSGPGRDQWLELLHSLLPPHAPFRRCPARIDDERLLGGLDLPASLALGTSVLQRGLLSEADGGAVVFAMAECLPTGLGAQIASVLDQGGVHIARDGIDASHATAFTMILLDEGGDDDERAPDALLERCAFRLETGKLEVGNDRAQGPHRHMIETAQALLAKNTQSDEGVLEALCETAFAFGINSARPVLYAMRAADAIGALNGRIQADMSDAVLSAQLILAPLATRMPPHEAQTEEATQDGTQVEDAPQDQQAAPPSDPEPDPGEADQMTSTSSAPPTDMLIETVKAALPEGLLAALMAGKPPLGRKSRDREGRGSGEAVNASKRGRPVGSRRGSLRSGQRLHLIDTLRAAAPWQKLRQSQSQTATQTPRVLVQPQDIRVRRFVEKRETTIVFVVDASGSAAWQRLAEAKGAVQLMLAHAYQTRARVALVAFRKDGAEVILPPTRSLTRARRLLADMAGGGGTPLASGLETALTLALSERKKGRTPRLLLLTDGAGNVARDGTPGRPQAQADASAVARQIALANISAVHIDTATRPRLGAHLLASQMGAKYAPLPSPRSRDLAFLAGLAG